MRRPWRPLVALVGLVVVPVLAVPEPAADELEHNRRLLESWRADPEHYQRLWRDLRAFYALSPQRQRQLRRLDRQLHEADPATQRRLWAVLERYHTWLERLPEADRQRVLGAASPDERLAVIRALRERQWVERLPRGVRAELDKLPEARRKQRVAELRREARQQRIQWQRPLRQRDKPMPRPARLTQFPAEVQKFVKAVLEPMLSAAEKKELHEAEGKWPNLARRVAELSDRHPVLPPLPGKEIRKPADLPPDVKRLLPGRGPDRRKNWKPLAPVIGKWPDFALAVTRLIRENKKVPPPLGASRPGEFPSEADEFLARKLLLALNPVEANRLKALEGRWPDYPKRLLELARRKHLVIPGMSLPGPRDLWDSARLALPEVPGHLLRDFALAELSAEDRARLGLSVADPEASRERLKKAYFKRKPRELERLRGAGFLTNAP